MNSGVVPSFTGRWQNFGCSTRHNRVKLCPCAVRNLTNASKSRAAANPSDPQSWSVFHVCDPVNTSGAPLESSKYRKFAETTSGFLTDGFACASAHRARQHIRTSHGTGFHRRCDMRPFKRVARRFSILHLLLSCSPEVWVFRSKRFLHSFFTECHRYIRGDYRIKCAADVACADAPPDRPFRYRCLKRRHR